LKGLSKYFTFFAQLGSLFEARFLRPLWNRRPSPETDDWEAVALFLEGYASERQGASPDYHHIATDVINKLARQRAGLLSKNAPQRAWALFCIYAKNVNLNYANNPLCPQNTPYVRKTGSAITYNKSVIEFLHSLSDSGVGSNIVVFARSGLELDYAKGIHNAIQEINGIGPKIASLFLRDVAIMYDLTPTKDRYLLQPVDVWVERVFQRLAPQKVKNQQGVEPVQRWILKEATRGKVCAEVVNAGMWYFSSQIVGSNYRLSKALSNLKYAEILVEQYIEAVSQEVAAATMLAQQLKPAREALTTNKKGDSRE